MAEQRIDAREVRKIKTAIAQSGQKKAEARFGNSQEMQQVRRQLQKGQARAVDRHRAARHDSTPETTSKKENRMVDNTKKQQKQVPATAQQRVTQRQQAQARQNARLKDRSKNQSQGMGM
ncbi:hypothetical protein QFZ53_002802 [Microbacterium natoriense]|uniref:Uncharacterized protein n=1 Tax=Microbacterium natoriense TaxID=284570 RepID=A0AAW8EZ69_9MICO|nr:hypothetical protein [Microbacterium natoriense]MDQ0648606.1 hypothetical protein [Microbacterium natoriense]